MLTDGSVHFVPLPPAFDSLTLDEATKDRKIVFGQVRPFQAYRHELGVVLKGPLEIEARNRQPRVIMKRQIHGNIKMSGSTSPRVPPNLATKYEGRCGQAFGVTERLWKRCSREYTPHMAVLMGLILHLASRRVNRSITIREAGSPSTLHSLTLPVPDAQFFAYSIAVGVDRPRATTRSQEGAARHAKRPC